MSDRDDILPPPQPTSSLLGGMFGLGPLMKLINDPGLGDNARKAIQAIIEGQARIVRIEEKLDRLLGALGDGSGPGRIAIAAVPSRVPDRTGADAAPSHVAHSGAGGDAAATDQAQPAPRDSGDRRAPLLDAGRHRRGAA